MSKEILEGVIIKNNDGKPSSSEQALASGQPSFKPPVFSRREFIILGSAGALGTVLTAYGLGAFTDQGEGRKQERRKSIYPQLVREQPQVKGEFGNIHQGDFDLFLDSRTTSLDVTEPETGGSSVPRKWRLEVSPDGQWGAFVGEDPSGEAGVYVTHLTEGAQPRLVEAETEETEEFRFSPDGTQLALVKEEKLMLYDLTDGEYRRVHEFPGNLTSLDWWSESPENEGEVVVSTEHRIFQVDMETRVKKELSAYPLGCTGNRISDLAISPKGGEVAYRCMSGIQILDLETEETRRITNDSPSPGLSWSPDGERIAFTFGDLVCSVDRRGQKAVALTPDQSGLGIVRIRRNAWSPDGRQVAFISDKTRRSLHPESGLSNICFTDVEKGEVKCVFDENVWTSAQYDGQGKVRALWRRGSCNTPERICKVDLERGKAKCLPQ